MTPEQQKAIAIAEARKRQAEAAQPQASDAPAAPVSSLSDKIGAFLTGASDLPVVGPAIQAAERNIGAAIVAPFSDQSFSDIRNQMAARQQQVTTENPGTALAGNIAGNLATLGPMMGTGLGARAFGVTGPSLLARMGASAATNAGISGADTAVRGGGLDDILKSAAVGGAVGGAIPGVSEGASLVGGAIKDAVGPRINALIKPTQEAQRRVGQAISSDVPAISPADQAAALVNQQPVRNIDLGGEQARALLRSAANNDPEARGQIQRFAQDRFENQGQRAQSFISRLMNGQTDDLTLQASIKAAARKANGPAYAKAYEEGDRAVWSPELERLSGAPVIQDAMKGATGIWRNVAIADGYGAANPGALVDRGGMLSFLNGKVPVFPNLQFWDYTKRILDDEIGAAVRSGADQKVRTLTQLKGALTQELDKQAPSYAAARQGAASFFGAEDALDAGRKFVTQNKTIPETRNALMKMSQAERDAFATGFASELKDTIAATRDRTNVIDRVFGSQQARDKIKLALGPDKYKDFEAFVNVENGMDMLRGALGNSTTARQLKELGLASAVGAGAGYMTGDWKSGVASALMIRGARAAGAKVDSTIAKNMANLLLSDDPQKVKLAVQLAAKSPKALEAVKYLQKALVPLGIEATRESVQ